MITGIGTDIVETARIEKAILKNKGFKTLVFTEAEIVYCEKQGNPFQHFAARFAAKESFFKAIGTGWVEGTAFNEVEVKKNEKGKPYIVLTGQTASTLQQLEASKIWLSLSHIANTAIATVVIEQ